MSIAPPVTFGTLAVIAVSATQDAYLLSKQKEARAIADE